MPAQAPASQPRTALPRGCFSLVPCSGRPRLLPRGATLPVGSCAVRETQPRVVFWVPCHLMSLLSPQWCFGVPLLLCFSSQLGPVASTSSSLILLGTGTKSSAPEAPSPFSAKAFLTCDSSDTHSVGELSPGGFVAEKSHASPFDPFSLSSLSFSPAPTCPGLVVSAGGSFVFLQPLGPVFLGCLGIWRHPINPK